MSTKKILIIDDNGVNGIELSAACKALAPEWEVLWFRVISPGPDPLTPKNITYRVIGDAGGAAASVRETAGDAASCDLIVFYDLQLLGVQGTETRDALESPITLALKGLMEEPGRRMMTVIHSASFASPVIAESLDKSGRRTRLSIVTGKDRAYIRGEVRKALDHWASLYSGESMSAEEFLTAMEGMTHGQIQEYARFLKERREEERRLSEETLGQKYQDPKEVLKKYLLLGLPEFEESFCDGGELKGEVVEALKCIAGVGRRLSWGGAWLLALGVFRQLLPREPWKSIFDPSELGSNQQQSENSQAVQKWPSVHAVQKWQRRGETVRLFVVMCKVLFTKKDDLKVSVLEKVELAVDHEGKPEKLSFRLSFPCVAADEDQSESLLGRLVEHVDTALAVAEGRQVEQTGGQGRDTSRAIWRFFLSAAICDSKPDVGRPGYGMAGGFTPMNIMSISNNTKTEVLWLT